jgi:hypothetical protein
MAGGRRISHVDLPQYSDDAATRGYVDSNFISTTSSLWGGTKNGNIWNGDAGLGRVGIGTTNPAQALHIESSSTSGVRERIRGTSNSANAYSVLEFGNDTAALAGGFFVNSSNNTTYGGGSSMNLINIQSAPLTFGTNNTINMTILSGGNVGIGTTAPTARLNIVGANGAASSNAPNALTVVGGTNSSDGYKAGGISLTAGSGYGGYTGGVGGDVALTSGAGGPGFNGSAGGNVIIQSGSSGVGSGGTSSNAGDIKLIGADSVGYSPVRGGNIYIDAGNNSGGVSLPGNILFSTVNTAGKVGIGTTLPNVALEVNGIIRAGVINGISLGGDTGRLRFSGYASGPVIRVLDTADNYGTFGVKTLSVGGSYAGIAAPTSGMIIEGSVGIGTTSPAAKLEVVDASNSWSIMAGGRRISHVDLPQYSDDAATRGYVDANYAPITGGSYLPLAGSSMTGDINMQTHNITALGTATIGTLNVTKITAVTIDPLYSLNGINYATFVSSISGGVKEEYVGKIKINEYNSKIKAFEAIIDFNNIKEGSDLWVWHKVVDFNSENVDAAITPYNGFANVYYLIDGDKLIFRSNKSITASYRLIGKRFDWRNWPTKALDQTIKGIEIK